MREVLTYTKKELLALPPKPIIGNTFNAITIVPTIKKHDSGFRCMRYIFEKFGEIVGVEDCGSDVLELGRIREVCPSWCIECLPKSGCVSFWNDYLWKVDYPGVSTITITSANKVEEMRWR